ncbi:hypothetical protein PybrP1_008414 [[Pythium] brassicae (nom. inval.)]|nr:hypothetical protein PybrP1_008414 [[Pythium] brassicae (nom. inval.)]
MNYGIIQNRRHDNKRDGGKDARTSSLLQDTRLREMAKQLGLGPEHLRHESAHNLWQLLDDMAADDPDAYQRFVQGQLAAGPPPQTESAGDDKSNSNQVDHDANQHGRSGATKASTKQPVLLPRYVTPYPGFVVKCVMLHTVKCQQQETKLFLNCCAHEMVDTPKNPNSGKDVPEDTRTVPSTSNLEVPLAVGKLREVADTNGALSVACDVIFHPWVMRRCEWDANFKREVMKLAVHWVQQDASVRLVHQVGKFIKSRYKGGAVSSGGDVVTAKFLIEPPTTAGGSARGQSQPASNQHESLTTSSAMKSPSELLKQVQLKRGEDGTADSSLEHEFVIKPARVVTSEPVVTTKSPTAAQQQSRATLTTSAAPTLAQTSRTTKLIEEIGASASELPLANTRESAPTVKPAKKAAVVKKGFLLGAAAKAKKPLYPAGSSEGHAPSPYVKLLSRSKVVDLSDVEQQRQQHDQKRKELAKDLSFLAPPAPSPTTTSSGEADCGDFEFEQLCMDADPDLKPPTAYNGGGRDAAADPVRELFGDGLDNLSRFLSPS